MTNSDTDGPLDLKKLLAEELFFTLKTKNDVPITEIKSYINKGINLLDEDGKTYIMVAAEIGRLDLVEYFITRDVNLEVLDKDNKDLLQYITKLYSDTRTNGEYIFCPDYRKKGEKVFIEKSENWVNLLNENFQYVANNVLAMILIMEYKNSGRVIDIVRADNFVISIYDKIILKQRFPRNAGLDFNDKEEVMAMDKIIRDLYQKISTIAAEEEVADDTLQNRILAIIYAFSKEREKTLILKRIQKVKKRAMPLIESFLKNRLKEVLNSAF